MGKLTTHVLDTMSGTPAADVPIELYFLDADRQLIKQLHTNSDGRCDEPLLIDDEMRAGQWELVFDVQHYFQGKVESDNGLPFLSQVPLRFGISDANAHYHVPLLVSPWSYTTYRGS